MRLSKKFSVPHIPVFIDPWVDIVYYKNFKRSRLTLAFDNYLEKKVLLNSKSAVFVTRTMKEDYERKYGFLKGKSHVLYWGYNEENFINTEPEEKTDAEVIIHAGNIFDFQNTPAFWKKVKEEVDCGRNLKIKFIGTVSPEIKLTIEKNGLNSCTDYMGFLPYGQMLKELRNASYLLVCSTEKRHVPGKLFEYLRTGKPIIAFGDDNEEVKNILEDTNAGMIFRYNEDAADFFTASANFKTDFNKVKKFDRKNIAEQLSGLLNF